MELDKAAIAAQAILDELRREEAAALALHAVPKERARDALRAASARVEDLDALTAALGEVERSGAVRDANERAALRATAQRAAEEREQAHAEAMGAHVEEVECQFIFLFSFHSNVSYLDGGVLCFCPGAGNRGSAR